MTCNLIIIMAAIFVINFYMLFKSNRQQYTQVNSFSSQQSIVVMYITTECSGYL